MKERISELQERVGSVRSALEALAERAAGLRGRVAAARAEETSGSEPTYSNGGSPSHQAPGAVPGSLAHSLEQLTVMGTGPDMGEGDDGRFVSDAWEIALINEEGK
jgi:hypothetical protein